MRIWIGIRSKSAGDAGLARCITASTGPGTQMYVLTSWWWNVKPGAAEQPLDVLGGAGDQVVDGDDLVAAFEQRPAQVRSEEARPSGDDDPRHGRHRKRRAMRRRR